MNNKPEIVFTFTNTLGGTSSFNYNIINYSKLIKLFHSTVILLKEEEDKTPLFTDIFNVDKVINFTYSKNENQFYVTKRLNELLGSSNGAIVTDNFLTIGAAKLFNNPKTVFNLIHDYFYVHQNSQLGNLVDVAIAHSSFFSDAVFSSNPTYFGGRSFYIPYGVKQLSEQPVKNDSILNLVFLGRLIDAKGVLKLYQIEAKLKERNVDVKWSIIGKGPLKSQIHEQWKSNNNVTFYEPGSTEEVYKILYSQDVFIFPTVFEGTPVAILECLANGIVTITNDLPGGIRDIITEDIGFRCQVNNIDQFVEKILLLHNQRTLLKQLQKNCYELSLKNFDIDINADNYLKLILQYEDFKRAHHKPVRFSLLDKAIFPNALVKFIRGIKNNFSFR